ncbi:hypothetical protein QF023_003715 [Chryseobacterium sp. SLBN-27]|nr:hypothetical protein [Chryseobacterium sp. SLBN-27]MDR6160199.1 hypothetical protein [Chryseobacterium sp. SLBN-27]
MEKIKYLLVFFILSSCSVSKELKKERAGILITGKMNIKTELFAFVF